MHNNEQQSLHSQDVVHFYSRVGQQEALGEWSTALVDFLKQQPVKVCENITISQLKPRNLSQACQLNLKKSHTFAQSPSQPIMLRAASNISPRAVNVTYGKDCLSLRINSH